MTTAAARHERMARWDTRTKPVIVVAAIAPLVLAFIAQERFDGLILLVDLVSWLVFVIDFVVRQRIDPSYWRSGAGVFDGLIVLLTFPYYILPGVDGVEYLSVFRTARLVRLVTVAGLGRRSIKAFRRLGLIGFWVAALSFIASILVLQSEPPESGFETFGDALWWAMVSFTTVGYGDLYPVTPLGRFAGILMMITGLAALGSIAAILGSAIGASDDEDEDSLDTRILAEISALRTEVADLKERLDRPD